MDIKEKYLKEVSHQLQRAGFYVWPEHEGLLLVEWKGELLCRVSADMYLRNMLLMRKP